MTSWQVSWDRRGGGRVSDNNLVGIINNNVHWHNQLPQHTCGPVQLQGQGEIPLQLAQPSCSRVTGMAEL